MHQPSDSDEELEVHRDMSPATLYKAARKAQVAANSARESEKATRHKYEDLLNDNGEKSDNSHNRNPRKS
ncbi:hypothetical protein SERLA73DRAFT_68627 [Serpula lacrymans var. lacrymans S7.3]|uniref:Uncharacterized protein n=2 Tax=Serpula lacrymans var. lacrymans TaxID=341189 RepID=F8PHC6_SERL3|nr:uncharacterized protein SERLADRAFT_432393 [Serpula lacrymans var. lacrymans S7.9]EGO04972.1 hypothetical protein SERLA73DRAFT_68627 [Serpula lacrymans var. lacrymans S7.3]EGO30766.1 hypothetical protein SERLADRAFT_432393 [Serpula lacrymans var. lacrymans S7.9]